MGSCLPSWKRPNNDNNNNDSNDVCQPRACTDGRRIWKNVSIPWLASATHRRRPRSVVDAPLISCRVCAFLSLILVHLYQPDVALYIDSYALTPPLITRSFLTRLHYWNSIQCIRLCIRIDTHVQVRFCMYSIHPYLCMHVCKHVCQCIIYILCMCVNVYEDMYCICIIRYCSCKYACMYAWVYGCMRVSVYMYQCANVCA